MTEISGLTISDEKPNGKTFYEPAVLTVKGTSQYNENQISFVEIQGFWQLPENFTGKRKPPDGTVAKFTLSTKPKSGQNAKPGSMHMDIGGIYKTDEQPIEQADPREEYVDDQQPATPQLTLDQRIAKAQAWNGLTERLAGNNPWEGAVLEHRELMWEAGFDALIRGKTPFNEPDPAEKPEPEFESGMAPPEESDEYGAPESIDW